jgi:hypothetical protein
MLLLLEKRQIHSGSVSHRSLERHPVMPGDSSGFVPDKLGEKKSILGTVDYGSGGIAHGQTGWSVTGAGQLLLIIMERGLAYWITPLRRA